MLVCEAAQRLNFLHKYIKVISYAFLWGSYQVNWRKTMGYILHSSHCVCLCG